MNCGSHHGQCGCGLTYEQALQYFETYIGNALLCGKLQGGLHACDSETILPTGTNVVTCAQLKDKVNELIEGGDLNLPGIQGLEFDGERLTLTDQAGKSWQVDLSGLMDKAVENLSMGADGNLTLTLKDGTQFNIPLEEYLADLVKDAGITGGTLDQNGDLVLNKGDGETITIDMGALKKVCVDRDGPIIGDGSEGNCLDIDFSRVCWQVIESMHFTDEGLVIQIANQCDPVTLPLDEILGVLNNKVKVCTTNQGIITGDGSEGNCLALDLSKLVDLLVNNQTLINNIATALNYKVKVAVTQGITGYGTEANPLNVKLSTDSGNLLSLRDNGLYYGVTAEANVTNLYVDSATGDDTNPGTRASPLKTITRAVAMVRSDQSNTIHLRAGGRFVWPQFTVTGGATRVINVYADPFIDGDKVPQSTPEKTSYNGYLRNALVRPTVYLEQTYNETNHTYNNRYANVTNGGQLSVYGVKFEAKGYNEPGSGLEPDDFDGSWARWEAIAFVTGNSSGIVQLQGCVFDMYYAPCEAQKEPCNPTQEWHSVVEALAWGTGMPTVTMTNCCHLQKSQGAEDTALGTALVQASPANCFINVVNNGDSWGNDAGYEYLDFNVHTLPAAKIVSGITRDTDGKPRNILSNLVL